MLSLEKKRNERIPNHPQMVQLSLFLSQDGGAPPSDGKRRLEEAPAVALPARTHLAARRLPRPAPRGGCNSAKAGAGAPGASGVPLNPRGGEWGLGAPSPRLLQTSSPTPPCPNFGR